MLVLSDLYIKMSVWHPRWLCHRQLTFHRVPPPREAAQTTKLRVCFSPSPGLLYSFIILSGNPLQDSCLENPVDRGAWWAAVHGVAQRCTRLKQLSMHECIGEVNGNPLQCSCLENPRDGGAWWAAIYGVTQSWTRLKWLSSSSNSNIFCVLFLGFLIILFFFKLVCLHCRTEVS